MKKLLLLCSLAGITQACSIISELTAFTRCEFRIHSIQDPAICNIDISNRSSWSDFTFMEGQRIAGSLLGGTLPVDMTANIEIRNPGPDKAAVRSIQWKAFIDDVKVVEGTVQEPVEVPPAGGRSLVPVRVHTDLFRYLEGENATAMLNFALNLIQAGDQSSRFSIQIKPSVLVGSQPITYPGYFTVTGEFSPGN